MTGHVTSTVLLATAVTAISMWIAWRDVKISARLMLWIEAVSVSLVVIVVALVLGRHGAHADVEQVHLSGVTGSGLRLGLVLALFSFVGFESATTLGAEARDPLKTIPRAVLQSSLLGGAFFAVCAYTEVLGFRIAGQNLGTSDAPLQVRASVARIPVFGILIDLGAVISMFAGTLACITAAARVLLLMSHNGLTHGSLRATHARNETPSSAILVTGLAAVIPVVILPLAVRADLTFTAGSARSPRTDSLLRMASFPSRCPAICAITTASSTPPRGRFLGLPSWPCYWPSPEIFIRCPRGRTANCPTSIWPT